MTKKGKIKQKKGGAASTSKASSSEQSQSEQISQQQQQQQQQEAWDEPQQQVQTEPPQWQQQEAWGGPQQQVQTILPQWQQQEAWDEPQQQVQTIPPQWQQQGAWDEPQQQMQTIPPQWQQQEAWDESQQQVQTIPPQWQQQGAWNEPQQQVQTIPPQWQQQGAWDEPQQQVQTIPPQWQQQEAWGEPQQQVQTIPPQWQQQEAWGESQQQVQTIPPQWQQQGAWDGSQQQVQTIPPRWQQQGAWGGPQQQVQTRPPRWQQKGAWGGPQQQMQTRPPRWQHQEARWDHLQQQVLSSQSQQQEAAWSPQFMSSVGYDQQTQAVKRDNTDAQQPQSSASDELLELSQVSWRDTLNPTMTFSNRKMTSSAMKQYRQCIPERQDVKQGGKTGTPIHVWTNLFKIILNENFVTNAVHYDVTITPAVKTLYRKVFEQCRSKHFGDRYPAFDGMKNVYSANDLPFGDSMKTDIIISNPMERDRTFNITLNKVAVVDLSWLKTIRAGFNEADGNQTSIQVLDIIMRHVPDSLCRIGRSVYWPDNERNRILLGSGISLRCGRFSSAVLGWKPYLNVDVAYKAIHTSQNVIALMADLTNQRYPPSSSSIVNCRTNWDKINKFLKGLRVVYQINIKRTYRLNGLGPTATNHTFEYNKSLVTIAKYFAQTKNYILRHPDLPCLWAGPSKKKIYFPAELCTIAPDQPAKQLNDKETKKMIKTVTLDAPTRKARIKAAFEHIDVNTSPVMTQEFHLSVDTRMIDVEARILPAPKLRYAKDQNPVQVAKGVWTLNQKFNEAMNLNNWTILNLSGESIHGFLIEFANALKQNASGLGMEIKDPCHRSIKNLNPRDRNCRTEIKNYFKSNRHFSLILVIMPVKTDIYGLIKQISEVEIGILTQCITLQNFKNRNHSTMKNILLKINSKLNGINHTFNTMPGCLQHPSCMLVGADVTHPSPHSDSKPSIAAVAASHDTKAFKYNIQLRFQEPKEEMITDLEDMITSHITIYRNKLNCLPERIIYYRDGVSEGQLAQVMHFEIAAIKRACAKFKAGDIQITCVIVQKRHHVRFFPTHSSESDDRNCNVRAGTIVDTEIIHPHHIDFYLVSHASIQGTARPTKYRCICNESNYTIDQLEELTYYLCHIFARCARAVSYPAPTYYAHLAAKRGAVLTHEIDIRLDNIKNAQHNLNIKLIDAPMCFI